MVDLRYCPNRGDHFNSCFAMIAARLGKIRPRYRISKKLILQLRARRDPPRAAISAEFSNAPLVIADEDRRLTLSLFRGNEIREMFLAFDFELHADEGVTCEVE